MTEYQRIVVTEEGSVTAVRFRDRKIIDAGIIHELGEELFHLVDVGKIRLLLDWTIVEFLSSSALNIVRIFDSKVKRQSGSLRMCNMKEEIYEVMAITRLNQLFEIMNTISAPWSATCVVSRPLYGKLEHEQDVHNLGMALNWLLALDKGKFVVVDLNDVSQRQHHVAEKLVAFQEWHRERGGNLRLCNVRPSMQAAFAELKLFDVFEVFESVDAACEGYGTSKAQEVPV